jgi:hypothetical protein
MSKFNRFVRGAFVMLPLTSIFADAEPAGIAPHESLHETTLPIIQESIAPIAQETLAETKAIPAATPVAEKPLNPFTGKIRGKRVRMRANADLESRIIKELDKNDLVTVLGEKGDFFAVEAPANSKAYIFRSFVLDNVVEGNRVNIRLNPDTEAPILGQLNSGEHVQGKICQENPKWLEISVPSSVHFYVAKEFVENIGGPEMKGKIEKRKETVTEMFDSASFMTKVELRKPFSEMDVEKIQHIYKKIISDFDDFPEYVDHAKDAMAALQDAYVQKRIAFLEAKISGDDVNDSNLLKEELVALDSIEAKSEDRPTDKMLLWEPIEEALYLDWAALHEDHSIQEFYEEQKTLSSTITGILEPYLAPGVKNKPGSHVLKDKDLPVAYVYSTKINLENYVGKKVTLRGVERPNNHFAFPAYFILSQE